MNVWIKIIGGIVILTLGMLAYLYAIDSRNRAAPETQEFSEDHRTSTVPETTADDVRQQSANLRYKDLQLDTTDADSRNVDEPQLNADKPGAAGADPATSTSLADPVVRGEREALDAILSRSGVMPVDGDGPTAGVGSDQEARVLSMRPAPEDAGQLPPEFGQPGSDAALDGLAPEAGYTGELGPAPEAGQPLSVGPPPESSDPGTMGPGP